MRPAPPLPPPDPTIRHVYTETGWGAGCAKMNAAELARADARPWYRRMWGLPSQDEIDSWGLQERD